MCVFHPATDTANLVMCHTCFLVKKLRGFSETLRLQARGAGGGRERAHYVKMNLNIMKETEACKKFQLMKMKRECAHFLYSITFCTLVVENWYL